MDILSRFKAIDEKDKIRAVRVLVEDSTPDYDFFLMLTLSVLMATLGLLAGSETIVIGSMLIAPLLYPVLGISLGLSMSNQMLLRRSLGTIFKGCFIAVGSGVVGTMLFSFVETSSGANAIILSRTAPTLLYLFVAVLSGLAVTYALVKPKLSETLPGVAISVALIPPLAVVGIGIAWLSIPIAAGALVMFLVNVLGIITASLVSFSLMNVHGEQKIAQSTIKKEEKRVEQEEEKVREVAVEEAIVTEGLQ